jgi:hypothetical protein
MLTDVQRCSGAVFAHATTEAGMRSSPVVTVSGIVYGLIGLVLGAGGAWLVYLGGSVYYVLAGIGFLVTGGLLIARRRAALWVYAAVLIGTLLWAVAEVAFDWWPLAARGDVVLPLAIWLLTPWVVRHLDRGPPASRIAASLPLWLGVIASAVVLVIGLGSTYHEIDGAFAVARPAKPSRLRTISRRKIGAAMAAPSSGSVTRHWRRSRPTTQHSSRSPGPSVPATCRARTTRSNRPSK